MNIYVDFDDCLCETAKAFSDLALKMFGIDVPYEKMAYFNLQKTFGLTEEQYDRLMTAGHEPEAILAYEETPGASEVINGWIRSGCSVSIITGRPYNTYEVSRRWLDEHGFQRAEMYCLNKYGRENLMKGSRFSLEPEDYYRMKFDYAVEDSAEAFRFFSHLPELRVLVYDRPWNRNCPFPDNRYRRCTDWESIRKAVSLE